MMIPKLSNRIVGTPYHSNYDYYYSICILKNISHLLHALFKILPIYVCNVKYSARWLLKVDKIEPEDSSNIPNSSKWWFK